MKIPLATRLALGTVSDAELLESGRDPAEIRRMKSELPMAMRVFSTPRVIKSMDEDKLTIDYAATIQVADRGGDIVQVQKTKAAPGGSFDAFVLAGAPFLWAHNRSEDLPPIGKVVKIQPRKRVEFPKDQGTFWTVIETVEYQPADDLPISQAAFRLASEGTLRSVSIGFVPTPGMVNYVEDEAERKRLGLGMFGVWFMGWDQIELSQTPTPMHPLAIGLESKALAEEEGRIRKGLDQLVAKGQLPKSLVNDVAKELLPLDREKHAADNVRGFFDVARSVGALRGDGGGAAADVFEWCGFDFGGDDGDTVVDEVEKMTGTGSAEEPKGIVEVAKSAHDAAVDGNWLLTTEGLDAEVIKAIADALPDEPDQEPRGFVETAAAVLGLKSDAGEADVMSAIVSLAATPPAPTSGMTVEDHDRLRKAFDHFCAGEDLVGRVMDSVTVGAQTTPTGVERTGDGGTVADEGSVEKALLRVLERALKGSELGDPADDSKPNAQGASGSTATILSEVARAHDAVQRSRSL